MIPSSKPRLLVVDDEQSIREALVTLLEDQYLCQSAPDGESALGILEKNFFSVVLLDIVLPDISGEEVLSKIRNQYPGTEVIMVTAVKEIDQAVRCMKSGAYDYISKPWDVNELLAVIRRGVEKWSLSTENALMKTASEEENKLDVQILGDSSVMQDLRDRIAKVAVHDTTILINGESGTGKGLVARSIHAQSSRKKGRFVAISCAAMPETLVESELFGHEKGAFSSAVTTRIGKFEYASGGTLFLDDVATLPMEIQAKLLRVLQEREITRLGSNRTIPVDVRVVSATNENLQELVGKGRFREDLYWRLCGVPLDLPALRDRGDDLKLLLEHFIAQNCRKYQKPMPNIPDDVIGALNAHQFPGNVRELQRLAETMVVLAENNEAGLSTLPIQLILDSSHKVGGKLEHRPLKEAVHEFEKQVILRALKEENGNQSKASSRLGIHRNTLILKMQELGIPNKRQMTRGY